MLSFKEALELLSSINVQTLESEKILFNQCKNRVLSKDIYAINDMPLFDTSSMDGYAFCYDDLNLLIENGLGISSINKAGNENDEVLKRGSCIKTFTGSKMPKDSDTMILVENVNVKDGKIFLKENENISKGSWIRKKGENYRKNDVLFKKGQVLDAFSAGLLAQNSNIYIEVFRAPKIALLSIGDEILELGEPLYKNYIYNSNNHLLDSILSSMGCEISLYPIIKDNKKSIQEALSNALQHCDIVITTGGMSKGDFDFTKDVIRDFGEVLIDGINIRPGRVSAYVKSKNKHIFALPGNPMSSVVVTLIFVRLIIQRMLGIEANLPVKKAKLAKTIKNNDTRICFLPSSISFNEPFYTAHPIDNFQSYMLDCMKDSFTIINAKSIEADSIVEVVLLNDLLSLKGV